MNTSKHDEAIERANPIFLARVVEGMCRALQRRREPSDLLWIYRTEAHKRKMLTFARMNSRELGKLIRKQEKQNMLDLLGKAEFKNEGKLLDLEVRIQPHAPVEHDMLARIAAVKGLEMNQGQLVLRAQFDVPAIPKAPAPELVTESSATSASEPANSFHADGTRPLTVEEMENHPATGGIGVQMPPPNAPELLGSGLTDADAADELPQAT